MGMTGRASLRWPDIRRPEITARPSFLSATHRLANFQFESSDALLNRPRDEQNCKHKRDSATGYGEDNNVMVCKKHGVPSDARYAGVLVPKCDGRSSEPAAPSAFPPGQVPRQCVGTHQGGSLFPFRHTFFRELVG